MTKMTAEEIITDLHHSEINGSEINGSVINGEVEWLYDGAWTAKHRRQPERPASQDPDSGFCTEVGPRLRLEDAEAGLPETTESPSGLPQAGQMRRVAQSGKVRSGS
jgi:hypothetical protein